MMSLGDVSEMQAAIGTQVYMELVEGKKYANVTPKFDSERSILYILATKPHKNHATSMFIPVSSNDSLSFNRISNYLDLCGHGNNIDGIFLVFVCADSTTVYYQIRKGLPKEIPTNSQEIPKRIHLDGILRKHRSVIEEAALCQTPITIPIVLEDPKDENEEETTQDR